MVTFVSGLLLSSVQCCLVWKSCCELSPEQCQAFTDLSLEVASYSQAIHAYKCMHTVGYAWMVWNTYWQRFLTYWGNSSNMLGVSSSCCKHDLLHWLVEHSHRELVRIRSQSPQVYIHLQVHATCVWFGVLAKRHTFPMKTGDIWPPLLQLFTAQGDSSGLLHCHLLFY